MSIRSPIPLRSVDDDSFDRIDKRVVACAYASQNALGRLCKERVYETDIAARLRSEGFCDVQTQRPVWVSVGEFRKDYVLDLIVNGVVYELKAVETLTRAHDAQVIHYAALLGLDRIKLLNLGSESVQGRLKRCPFAGGERAVVTVDDERWVPLSNGCLAFRKNVDLCLMELGGFLEASLYTEVLAFFSGGEARCVRRVPIIRDSLELGDHTVRLISSDVAFEITALEQADAYRRQLNKLLRALPIRAFQWLNVCHATATLVTLEKGLS